MNEQQVTEYLVIAKIGGAGDPEVWLPGSKIKLPADRAAAHLAAGNIRAIETTVLPPEPATTVIVHEAEPIAPIAEAAVKRGRTVLPQPPLAGAQGAAEGGAS